MSLYIDSESAFLRTLNQENKFAYPLAIKAFAEGRRYTFEGGVSVEQTNDGPKTKLTARPKKIELVFKNREAVKSVEDLCSFWQYVEKESCANPVFPNEVFNRLVQARKTGRPLPLFAPWGVRPTCQPTSYEQKGLQAFPAEQQVLAKLRDIQKQAFAKEIPVKLVIMPADLYATEINTICPVLAGNYFGALAQEVGTKDVSCVVMPWSVIRKKEAQRYAQQLCTYTEAKVRELLPPGMISNIVKSAKRFNSDKPEAQQEAAAFKYMRERLCEGDVVEESLRPIKLSLVDPVKDTRLDGPLPRLYLIPEGMRFPWLKAQQVTP